MGLKRRSRTGTLHCPPHGLDRRAASADRSPPCLQHGPISIHLSFPQRLLEHPRVPGTVPDAGGTWQPAVSNTGHNSASLVFTFNSEQLGNTRDKLVQRAISDGEILDGDGTQRRDEEWKGSRGHAGRGVARKASLRRCCLSRLEGGRRGAVVSEAEPYSPEQGGRRGPAGVRWGWLAPPPKFLFSGAMLAA